MTTTFIRQWVLRTVAKEPAVPADIRHHFMIEHPDHDLQKLEEVLENKKDLDRDDQGRLILTEATRRELEQIGG